jgi:hypothetical protein
MSLEVQIPPPMAFPFAENLAFNGLMHQHLLQNPRFPLVVNQAVVPDASRDTLNQENSAENLGLARVAFQTCWQTQLMIRLASFIANPPKEICASHLILDEALNNDVSQEDNNLFLPLVIDGSMTDLPEHLVLPIDHPLPPKKNLLDDFYSASFGLPPKTRRKKMCLPSRVSELKTASRCHKTSKESQT